MSRPGKKVTRKTIMMNSRIKEMELKERSSRSLLANVLDMDDDFRSASGISYAPTYNSSSRPSAVATAAGQAGNSSTLPTHFPSSASSYHQQQQQSLHHHHHHAESSLIHGNLIAANMQSSTFGSRTGGFNIDEDIPSTPYCIQVLVT